MSGKRYVEGNVSLDTPPSTLLSTGPADSDVRHEVRHWLARAASSENVHYFTIYWRARPVGQILLHDIEWCAGKALVAYHIFHPRERGKGIGTRALRLLQQFVIEETTLRTCVVITSRDNIASQRIARKCGFAYAGPPWEDPANEVTFAWNAPEHTGSSSGS